MEAEDTAGISPKSRRRRAEKAAAPGKLDDRVTLNVRVSLRARIIVDAHANLYRGTPRGSASGLIDALILEHLKEIKILN